MRRVWVPVLAAYMTCSSGSASDIQPTPPDPPRDAHSPSPSSGSPPAALRPALEPLLQDACAKNTIPAMAAMATRADGILEIAASGFRHHGRPDRVRPGDLFHLGSNTKAMTATLIGILVEEGKLSWTTTPLDVFPEWKDTILRDYQDVTITDLLSHHAGLAAYDDDGSPEFRAVRSLSGTPEQQRREFALAALRRKPAVPPKTKALYSNAGYSIAAAMAERVGGAPYETLMQSRLFTPLGIHPVLGWPAHDDAEQPWGHFEKKCGVKPHDPHDAFQLQTFLVPAGGFSISPRDYLTFLELHLRGLEGRDGLLAANTIKHLHTPVDEKFALGWGVIDLEGAPASVHSGSAGTFYAVVAIWPSRDLAVAVFASAGGDRAAKACGQFLRAMAHRYDPR